MSRARKRKGNDRVRGAMLAVLLLALAGLLLLRHQRGGERPADPSSAPEAAAVLETAAPTATPAPEPSTEPLAVLPTPTAPPAANAAESPAPAPGTPAPESQGYTEYTYGLVSDMVYTYRHLQSAGMETVRSDLEKLKEADPALGGAWERIMDCWVYVNTELEVNTEEIPAELPTDDSLVIVVLGFQLLPDGAMDPELIRRCELGLACAQQYPEAFVLVTGGGTALGNKEITEAGAMADWFLARGLDPTRLIVEKRALTTGQNAQYTCEILTGQYPQARNLLLVTSGYHMRMSCLLYTAEAILYEYAFGAQPYAIAGHVACEVLGPDEYNGTAKQAQYLWTLADPQY